MKILDTDILTLLFRGGERVLARQEQEVEEVAITIVSRIQTLQGRFDMLMKAADGSELLRAQRRLNEAVDFLSTLPRVVGLDERAAIVFDRLR